MIEQQHAEGSKQPPHWVDNHERCVEGSKRKEGRHSSRSVLTDNSFSGEPQHLPLRLVEGDRRIVRPERELRGEEQPHGAESGCTRRVSRIAFTMRVTETWPFLRLRFGNSLQAKQEMAAACGRILLLLAACCIPDVYVTPLGPAFEDSALNFVSVRGDGGHLHIESLALDLHLTHSASTSQKENTNSSSHFKLLPSIFSERFELISSRGGELTTHDGFAVDRLWMLESNDTLAHVMRDSTDSYHIVLHPIHSDGGSVLHIEPHNASHHHVYRRSDAMRDHAARFPGHLHSYCQEKRATARAPLHRWRREAGGTTCALALVADHRYFDAVGEADVEQTAALMIQAVADANAIYRQTSFGGTTGYGLSVARVLVYTTPSDGPVGAGTYTADAFLNAFTSSQWSEFCLAHIFTYYDFSGILGLAWVGSANSAGGICDTTGRNTGFTTLFCFGERVTNAVAMVVHAHE